MKNQKNHLFAVFGNPILHSKSPQIFSAAFNALDINGKYLRIRPRSAQNIVELYNQLGLLGANITAPYKESVIPYIDHVDHHAQEIGAVNTILKRDGKIIGFNTDWLGVTEPLKKAMVKLEAYRCLILGAGGAARAAAYGLTREKAMVFIANRTFDKAQQLADKFGAAAIRFDELGRIGKFDVVVSTLPFSAELSAFNALNTQLVFDANYINSPWKSWAGLRSIKYVGGEQWLLYQAKEAFRLFLNQNVSIELFSKGLHVNLSKQNLQQLFIHKNTTLLSIPFHDIDLIIDANGLSEEQQKQILNEEYHKAFGS